MLTADFTVCPFFAAGTTEQIPHPTCLKSEWAGQGFQTAWSIHMLIGQPVSGNWGRVPIKLRQGPETQANDVSW